MAGFLSLALPAFLLSAIPFSLPEKGGAQAPRAPPPDPPLVYTKLTSFI